MDKIEVLVDTCFFEKLSGHGKHIDDFKSVLDALDYDPVVHPYLYEFEMKQLAYIEQLAAEGYIRVASYSEFLPDSAHQILYEGYFKSFHQALANRVNASASAKHINELPLKVDIYKDHLAKSSMGDVHMIIMAVFTQIPIVLTDDHDITELRSIAANLVQYDGANFDIFDSADIIIKAAGSGSNKIKRDTLRNMLRSIGRKDCILKMGEAWERSHTTNKN